MNKKQLKIFSNLLSNGWYDCELYQGRFDFIKDKSNVSEDEFTNIPFSYKNDLRSYGLESRENHKSPTFGIFGSSGTTGKKTRSKFSMNDRKVFDKIASTILHRVGVKEGDIGVICAPILDGVMAHTMMWEYTSVNAAYVNCPVPSLDNFLEVLDNVHPTAVSGLPSALDFSLNPNFKVPENSSIKFLLTGGHYFSNAKRKIIEKKWNLNWYDFLGASEIFGPIMGECRIKNGLHYDHDLFLVEIIDQDTLKPIKCDGQIGVLVITPLWGKGSPLVRYWTDDLAYRISTSCPCGEKGDRIIVCGRNSDSLYINGKYIFPREIEEIMFSESSFPNAYIDINKNGEIVFFYCELTEKGKERISDLFGIETKFVVNDNFENMKKNKPSYFSKEIKEKFKREIK